MCKIEHPFRETILTRHHLIPKIRAEKNTHKKRNILMLWRDRHNAWHSIFKVYTFKEILENWYKFKHSYKNKNWESLFHDLSFDEAKKLLVRMKRRKNFACKHLL